MRSPGGAAFRAARLRGHVADATMRAVPFKETP